MWDANELLEYTLKGLAEEKPKDAWIVVDRKKVRAAAVALADKIVEMQTYEGDEEGEEPSDEEIGGLTEELEDAVSELGEDEGFDAAVESIRAAGKVEVTRKAGKTYFRWIVRPGRPKTVPDGHKRVMVRMTGAEHEQVKAFLKKLRKQ